jgi:hypothetical protein
MSENRIRKTDTVQSYGPASVGVWFDSSKTPKYNPDGTARYLAPTVVTYNLIASGIGDRHIFTAPFACKLIRATEVHGAAATSGSVDVKKCTGTQAPSAGTTMLASTFDLSTTAETVVNKSLSATAANLVLAAGDKVALDYTAGTIGSFDYSQFTLTFVQV